MHFLARGAHVLMRFFHRVQFLLLLWREQRTNLRHGVIHDRFGLLHRFFVDRTNLRTRLIDDGLDFGLLIGREVQILTQSIEHHMMIPAVSAESMFSVARVIAGVDKGQRAKREDKCSGKSNQFCFH